MPKMTSISVDLRAIREVGNKRYPEKKTGTMRYSSTGRIQRKITYTEFKAHDGKQDM
jgi:hypothetical protein